MSHRERLSVVKSEILSPNGHSFCSLGSTQTQWASEMKKIRMLRGAILVHFNLLLRPIRECENCQAATLARINNKLESLNTFVRHLYVDSLSKNAFLFAHAGKSVPQIDRLFRDIHHDFCLDHKKRRVVRVDLRSGTATVAYEFRNVVFCIDYSQE